MSKHSKGDGGPHWDERRQRWIATVTIGYNAKGKRFTHKARPTGGGAW
jgi:hypothetical protein